VSRWLLGARLALALAVLSVPVAYAAARIHERANVVDLELLPSAAAPAGAEPSPISPRDLPRENVREQVDFYPQGGPLCQPLPAKDGEPALSVTDPMEIGARVEICFSGFKERRKASVRIRGAGSQGIVETMRPPVTSWVVSRKLLPGMHRLRAVQGSLVATTPVRVVVAPAPFVRVGSFAAKPDTFQIVVGGAPRSRDAAVHLYRAVDSTTTRLDYHSTVKVPTDALGNGAILVRGTGGSTHTCYVAMSGFEGVERENSFCFAWDYD
jgi:hypothetical protein